MIGMLWLAVSPAFASEARIQETAASAQPAMALIDNSVGRLHVALDLSGLVGAGNGLVVNMMIANDEQARADTSIAALVARLPEGLLTRSLRKGLDDAWAANDGALLARAIEAAVLRACALALAPPPSVDPAVGGDEHVDVITALGGERFQGRVIDRRDSEVVIARAGGDLLVVPVQRVLTPLAGL